MGQQAGLGLVWFYGDDSGIQFLPGAEQGQALDWGALTDSVESGATFLSNLKLPALHERMMDHADAIRGVVHDKGMIVSITALADELGVTPAHQAPSASEQAVLCSIRDALQEACWRLGLNLDEVGTQQREIRRRIFERTASPGMRATSIEEADLSFSPAPHRWIKVPREWKEEARIKRVTLLRHTLYASLLRQPVPVGEWRMGSDSATPEMILNAVSERHDILLEADVMIPEADPSQFDFISVLATQEPRTLYTGQEVRRMVEDGIDFTIKRWWHGETAPAPDVPDVHPLSLADGLMLEMIHRSWRENPELGFWLSIAERMTLHHLASRLHEQGIEVCGFGSGKLTLIIPTDTETAQGLDQRILRENHAFGVQPPLSELRAHPDIASLVDYLTDQQVIALASPELLGAIGKSITQGDQESLDTLLAQADEALEAFVTEYAGTSTDTTEHGPR